MGIEGQFAGLAARTRPQPALVRNGHGKGYLSDIRRFAMLERDQEYKLAKRWRELGDREAADQLVTSHLRLAAKIAMGYRGYGLPVSEMISEGNVGLVQALNRFEPEKALFQIALGENQDRGARKRRPTSRPGRFDRPEPGCFRPGRHRYEPTPRWRQIDQCANPRQWRNGRMAGLSRRSVPLAGSHCRRTG